MNGHEQENVKKHHQQVFLPIMTVFESQIMHYKRSELVQVKPNLVYDKKMIVGASS